MKLISYTFTKEALFTVLKENLDSVARDVLDDALAGCPTAKSIVEKALRINTDYPIEEMIEDWAEFHSDDFFRDNPEISDVLLIVDRQNSMLIKIWMDSNFTINKL